MSLPSRDVPPAPQVAPGDDHSPPERSRLRRHMREGGREPAQQPSILLGGGRLAALLAPSLLGPVADPPRLAHLPPLPPPGLEAVAEALLVDDRLQRTQLAAHAPPLLAGGRLQPLRERPAGGLGGLEAAAASVVGVDVPRRGPFEASQGRLQLHALLQVL